VSDDQRGPSPSRAVQEHIDPEVLALRALGEAAGQPEDDVHLETCATCRGELDSLAVTAGTSRTSGTVALASPSPDVWQRVQTELGLPADLLPRAAPPSLSPAPTGPQPQAEPQAEPSHAAVTQLPRRHTHGSDAGPPRGRRSAALLVAAALVGALAGVGGTVLADRLTGDAGSDTVLAATPLDPLPTWQAGGSAEIVERADGERELRLDLSVDGAPTGDTGYREVWLIDRDVTKLMSLGVLRGDSGTFVLPEGVDLAEYPVVDVSLEPYDGQPAHSGDSIVRGILPT
jgi:Anti-sigma-K factor rskA